MPISVLDEGTDNVVSIEPDHLLHGSGTIVMRGSGNSITIKKPSSYGHLCIEIDGGSHILFGDECSLSGLFITAPNGASLTVGSGTLFSGSVAFHMLEICGVTIGDRCLIGEGARFWPSDMHSIVSLDTGRRINPPKNIIIGDRVWIA